MKITRLYPDSVSTESFDKLPNPKEWHLQVFMVDHTDLMRQVLQEHSIAASLSVLPVLDKGEIVAWVITVRYSQGQ